MLKIGLTMYMGGKSHDSPSSLDLELTSCGGAGLVVGLVPVSFKRGFLEGCGLRQLPLENICIYHILGLACRLVPKPRPGFD